MTVTSFYRTICHCYTSIYLLLLLLQVVMVLTVIPLFTSGTYLIQQDDLSH
jgi:hypothetical protein